ncbi:MAG TPA: glycosyltransferase family 39 protein [Trebonia sp.]|nr:glycosyltransferase family 39 protein [Trebonia sp.]
MTNQKEGRPVFGAGDDQRPDVLTDADTIILPVLGANPTSDWFPWADTPEVPDSPDSLPDPEEPGWSEAPGFAPPRIPAPRPPSGRPRHRLRRDRPQRDRPQRRADAAGRADEEFATTRRRTWISRLALLGILVLQAVLTLRLRNTAFEDEALYLYAGRMEIAHLLHGAAPQGNYAFYFSGAPALYPVAGAALNAIGGLALARALSLAEMLAVTAMVYAIARYLFNERVALCAAAVFSVSEPALFVGHLATYDATCLFLLAAAATVAVRSAACRWPVFLLAAPLAALAVAVKYAGALYLPAIAVLPALAGWPARGRRVLWYPAGFALVVAGLLALGLHLGGHVYIEAITGTTTNRAQGSTPDAMILKESAEWGGALTVLAAFGAVAYAWRARTEPGELIARSGGRPRRALLGTVMCGTAFLAPAYQMHLHTDVSLLKHVGFGLFFAAPAAGVGLVRLVGDHFRRPHFGVAAWCVALALGMGQSWSLYHAWPETGPFISAFSKHLAPGARYLVEVQEVPIYYLEGNPDAQPEQFWSTYNIAYIDKQGQTLTGAAGFTAAVRAGYFRVIAYDNTVTPGTDQVIARAIASSHSYYLAKVVRMTASGGPVDYDIWVKRPPRSHRPRRAPSHQFRKHHGPLH